MERAFTPGPTAKFTRVSGPAASKKARASGRVSMGTLTSVSGASLKPLGMECICGRTGTGTKVNGRIV